MDLRRLRAGEWIAAVFGVVLAVSLWLPWSERPGGATVDGWGTLAVVDVLLAALAVGALAAWAIAAVARAPGPGVAAEALLTPPAVAMTVVAVVKVLQHDGAGAAVALVAALGVLAGTLVALRDERLSPPGRPTDQTGAPVDEPPRVETLPGPPSA